MAACRVLAGFAVLGFAVAARVPVGFAVARRAVVGFPSVGFAVAARVPAGFAADARMPLVFAPLVFAGAGFVLAGRVLLVAVAAALGRADRARADAGPDCRCAPRRLCARPAGEPAIAVARSSSEVMVMVMSTRSPGEPIWHVIRTG